MPDPRSDQPGDAELYRKVFAHALNGIALHEIVTDADGQPVDYVFLEVNPAFESILGLRSADLIGKKVTEVFPGIEDEPWIGIYGAVALGGGPTRFSQYSDLLEQHFEVEAYSPSQGQFIAVFQDITERVRVEQELRHSEAMRRSMTDSSPDHIMLLDLEGNIRFINRTLETLNVEDVIDTPVYDYVDPRFHTAMARCFQEVIDTRRPGRYEVEYEYPDGRIDYFESRVGAVVEDGTVVSLTVAASNVTEQRELEERLRQAQKMEAVGRLAGGLAHDFNNLLTGIKGLANLTLERGVDDESAADMESVATLSDRAGALVGQLLAFSRQQPIRSVVLDINRVVGETVEMLTPLLGEDVRLEVDIDEDVANVRADTGQLQQVLLNLAVNARDAFAAGGTITIRTAMVDCPGSPCEPAAIEGECVCLTVEDDGDGMPPDTLQHIFEPFFTTKGTGSGSGLGLATVYGIVKQHKGHIEVGSEVGVGTRFDVFLPVVDEGVDVVAVPQAPSKAEGGSETVLLVEDEDLVRDVASRVLKAHGYCVLEAANSKQAQSLFDTQPVDLLLSDVVMPGGDGPSLFRVLTARDPDLKVLYMSGYMELQSSGGGISGLSAPFLAKPFAPGDLVEAVRGALDSSSA